MSNHGIRFTEMGSCYEGFTSQDRGGSGLFRKCAWEPEDCEPKQTFLGTDQDESIMRKCKPADQPVGRCLREDQCALRASDCASDTSMNNFNATDATCTIQRDKSKKWDTGKPEYTQFGSCKDTVSGEYFCIFNPEDCDESGTEIYATPSETLAAGVICDCSQVHVGACVTDSLRSFCAINEKGCRDGWPYYSPHTQRFDRKNGVGIDGTSIDCRLCRKRNTEEPTSAPTTFLKPTASPTKAPTNAPTITSQVANKVSSSATIESLVNDNNGISGTTAAIIGGSVGGVVFLGVFAFFYFKMLRGIKEDKMKDDKTDIPASFVIKCDGDTQEMF